MSTQQQSLEAVKDYADDYDLKLDWLDTRGWDHEPPAPELPNDVVAKTSERYREAYYKLTGTRL